MVYRTHVFWGQKERGKGVQRSVGKNVKIYSSSVLRDTSLRVGILENPCIYFGEEMVLEGFVEHDFPRCPPETSRHRVVRK